MRVWAACLVGALLLLLTLTHPKARAASCEGALAGAAKSAWGINATEATFEDAGLPDIRDSFDGLRDDAFDDYAVATVDTDAYDTPDVNACEPGMGGREIRFPPFVSGDVEITPSLYVDRRTSFGRELVTLRNLTSSPVTIDFLMDGELGSDAETLIFRSSNGTKAVNAADRWSVSCEDFPDDDTCRKSGPVSHDPDLANNWERDGAKAESADSVVLDDTDAFDVAFDDVTIPGGERISFMQLVTMAKRPTVALRAARQAGTDPAGYGALRGMSGAELNRLVNW